MGTNYIQLKNKSPTWYDIHIKKFAIVVLISESFFIYWDFCQEKQRFLTKSPISLGKTTSSVATGEGYGLYGPFNSGYRGHMRLHRLRAVPLQTHHS
jgi:hypothetical protein